ncbi:hypothetical protein [Mucilaginibacter pedocola]|nr:hypothetical protein [Mucilaginibacter pedocola]
MQELLRSIHFRKVFYLICLIVLVILFIVKFTVLPVITRREAEPKRILRHILDTLIGAIIAGMVVGGILFWVSGNE